MAYRQRVAAGSRGADFVVTTLWSCRAFALPLRLSAVRFWWVSLAGFATTELFLGCGPVPFVGQTFAITVQAWSNGTY